MSILPSVKLFFIHAEHALSHNKATKNIDGRDKNAYST
jgi:hypothetical protein